MRPALVIICQFLFATLAQAQFTLPSYVVSSGIATAQNENFQIVGTVGQPVIGVTSRSGLIVTSGFWSSAIDLITDVHKIESATLPATYRLGQNYPNPFNPTTTIEFALPKKSSVSLRLYDLLGREVLLLYEQENMEPGEYKIEFNATNLASGVYFYRLDAATFTKTMRLTLLK